MEHEVFIQTSHGRVDLNLPDSEIIHLDTHPDGKNLEQIRLFIQSWMYLLADSPLSTSVRRARDYRRFLADILSRPLLDTIQMYSRAIDEVLINCTTTTSYDDNPDSTTGVWVDTFRDFPIFREYHAWFRTGQPELLTYLMSFCYFGKKLRYEDPKLYATALTSWFQVESRLSDLVLNTDICKALSLIMSELLGPLDERPSIPKFGPGAVSESGVRGMILKANNLRYDARLDRAFFQRNQFWKDSEFPYRELILDPGEYSSAKVHSSRTAKLQFVWKDTRKARTICMEPNGYMYCQQSFLKTLLSGMDRGIARRFINVHDQSRNRALAKYGSETGLMETTDLTSASDSLSADLVRKIFPRPYLYFLLASRSSDVQLPDGSIVKVKKFAPMGSALCFPVQCLVFVAIAILAAAQHASGLPAGSSVPWDTLRRYKGRLHTLFNIECGGLTRRGKYEPLVVYGDDMVYDTLLHYHVTHLLWLLGFEVNKSKSFGGGQCFRESCGGYYFNGHDVTPLFFRVERPRGKIGPESFMSIVSGINNAGDWGYRSYAGSLIRHLRSSEIEGNWTRKDPIYFTNDRNAGYGVFSHAPRNSGLVTRRASTKSYDYQRDEGSVLLVSPRERRRPTAAEEVAVERYLYMRWCEDSESRLFYTETSGYTRVHNLTHKLGRSWVPVWR